jgi:hypothetical protein
VSWSTVRRTPSRPKRHEPTRGAFGLPTSKRASESGRRDAGWPPVARRTWVQRTGKPRPYSFALFDGSAITPVFHTRRLFERKGCAKLRAAPYSWCGREDRPPAEDAMITTVVTEATRTKTLRRVFFTMPFVAPPGVEWTAPHNGRRFELTSFKGGPVEVYCFNETTGLPMYQGTVRRYAPGLELRAANRRGRGLPHGREQRGCDAAAHGCRGHANARGIRQRVIATLAAGSYGVSQQGPEDQRRLDP